MHPVFDVPAATAATPITFVTKSSLGSVTEALACAVATIRRGRRLQGQAGPVPAAAGGRAAASTTCCSAWRTRARKWRDPFRPGQLPGLLPPGVYRFANAPHDARLAALAFALGSYRFSRYRKAEAPDVKLLLSNELDGEDLSRMAEAAALRAT